MAASEEQLARQRELPSWKAKQLEPLGQAEVAQSWVQVPPLQLVPLLPELSGMHRPPWHPALTEQGEPVAWGTGAQAPVLDSHANDEPQDHPRRQSGKQAETAGEHTYPSRQSVSLAHSEAQYELPSEPARHTPSGQLLTLQFPEQYPPIHARPPEVLSSRKQTPLAQDWSIVHAPPTPILPLTLQPVETANTANRRPRPEMKRRCGQGPSERRILVSSSKKQASAKKTIGCDSAGGED